MSLKPYFWKQTDKRWSSKRIGSMTLGAGGCGPTTIANIASPLLQKNLTPAKVWDHMKKKGYLIPGAGSIWAGITETLKWAGIKKFKVTYSDQEVREGLEKGCWMIGLCGSSRWTRSGHYITIYKLKANGKISVSDPYSGSDYCQEDGTLDEYLRCNKCNWILIDPKDYPGGQTTPADGKVSKVVILYVDTAKANIRKGRGLKYGIKGIVDRGTKLKLYALQDGWYKIKSGKYKGYFISETVLTRFEPYEHTYKALCPMNVRKGAGKSTAKKGTVKKGVKLVSSKRSGDWVYFPAIKGWIRVKSGDGKVTYMQKIK